MSPVDAVNAVTAATIVVSGLWLGMFVVRLLVRASDDGDALEIAYQEEQLREQLLGLAEDVQ